MPFTDKIRMFTDEYDCSADMTDRRAMTMYVVNNIDENRGYVNINELVERVGYSHCYTDRVFKNAVGLSMKQYANIVRIQRSLDILGEKNAADVCNDLGYYDQSHFIKDFKKFTLMTPKAYYKKPAEEHFV